MRKTLIILELDLKESKFLFQYENRKPKKVLLCNVGEYVIETNSTYEIHLLVIYKVILCHVWI